MLRSLLLLLGTALAAYLGYLALLFVQQRAVMFPGAAMGWDGVGRALPADAEAVAIPASFGRVQGVWLRARNGGARAPAVLYFHGNAEFVDQNVALLQPLAALGVHVLLIEYPGYAGTDGRPSRASLDEAAVLGYDWLATRPEVDPERLAAIGRSIGAGPAVALGRQRPLRALVLLAAFSSLDDFAHGMGAPAFLVRDRYDNRATLRDVDVPLLLFHGRRDDVIPYRHSERLADAARNATLMPLDCGHNDCPFFEPEFMARLQRFLAEVGLLGP
ncbi:MAG: prolyl oligopeptidase family serine peptidase [Gammaproteobacteria bacterium]|nr:prolyl oligopeptidase family serine peptidase [Gammaproteobacteria bacterium]